MTDILIRSKTDAGVVWVDSAEKLTSPAIREADGSPAAAPLIREQAMPGGGFRYWFDASELTRWTPDTPVLYRLTAGAEEIRFGYIELRAESNRALLLNGTPIYLRGYIRGFLSHEHPNMTGGTLREAAIKNIRQAKKFGFNLVRFHSTIPTEEFVEAADEEGMLIHMEIGFAFEVNEKAEKKNISMSDSTWEETILRFRNHPSVAIFCIGNELHNSGHYPEVRTLCDLGRRLAPSKLIMDNSGWGEFDRQTADVFSQHIAYFFPFKHHGNMFKVDAPWRINGSAYDEALDVSAEKADFRAEIHRTVTPVRPTLAHEAAHYIDIPDYAALERKFDEFCAKVGPEYLQANGIVKPKYFSEVRKLIARKHLEEKMPDYMAASRLTKLNALKIFFEKCRLSPLCGFEMLQFADCFVYENKNGIVDFFDDDKYITPEWMLRFNGDAALLAKMESEVFHYGDEIRGAVYISDFLPEPECSDGEISLSIRRADGSQETFYTGRHVSLSGGLQKIADISLRFAGEPEAREMTLCADFSTGKVKLHNEWKIWLYPRREIVRLPDLRLNDAALASRLRSATAARFDHRAVITDVLDDRIFDDLAAGKCVYLLYHRDAPGHAYYLPGALERFKPCIWDRGSNLGGVIRSEALRRALAGGRYFDLNWYSLLEGGYKVCLDDFPCPVEELVSGVDKPVRDRMKRICFGVEDFIDTDTLRNFSHLFSIRVGEGTLAVCTLRFTDPAAPPVEAVLTALLNDPEIVRTEKRISPEALKEYLKAATGRGVRREDTMNHFWEIDNKLVEDAEFWQNAEVDIRKIR